MIKDKTIPKTGAPPFMQAVGVKARIVVNQKTKYWSNFASTQCVSFTILIYS